MITDLGEGEKPCPGDDNGGKTGEDAEPILRTSLLRRQAALARRNGLGPKKRTGAVGGKTKPVTMQAGTNILKNQGR